MCTITLPPLLLGLWECVPQTHKLVFCFTKLQAITTNWKLAARLSLRYVLYITALFICGLGTLAVTILPLYVCPCHPYKQSLPKLWWSLLVIWKHVRLNCLPISPNTYGLLWSTYKLVGSPINVHTGTYIVFFVFIRLILSLVTLCQGFSCQVWQQHTDHNLENFHWNTLYKCIHTLRQPTAVFTSLLLQSYIYVTY